MFLPMYKSFDHIQIDFNFAKHIQKCLENYVTGFIDCEGGLNNLVYFKLLNNLTKTRPITGLQRLYIDLKG